MDAPDNVTHEVVQFFEAACLAERCLDRPQAPSRRGKDSSWDSTLVGMAFAIDLAECGCTYGFPECLRASEVEAFGSCHSSVRCDETRDDRRGVSRRVRKPGWLATEGATRRAPRAHRNPAASSAF